MTKDEILVLANFFKEQGIQAVVSINVYLSAEEDIPPDDDEDLPVTEIFQVTSEKSLAHIIKKLNKKKVPEFGMFPSYADEDQDDRIRFDKDDTVAVYPAKILGDGSTYWYEIAGSITGDRGMTLYLNAATGKVL